MSLIYFVTNKKIKIKQFGIHIRYRSKLVRTIKLYKSNKYFISICHYRLPLRISCPLAKSNWMLFVEKNPYKLKKTRETIKLPLPNKTDLCLTYCFRYWQREGTYRGNKDQWFSTEIEKLFVGRKNIQCRNYILIIFILKEYLNKPRLVGFSALRGWFHTENEPHMCQENWTRKN